jgi:hypothetical protein
VIGPLDETRIIAPAGLPEDPHESLRPTPEAGMLSLLNLQLRSTSIPGGPHPQWEPVSWSRQDPFLLRHQIGRGGFSDVFCATQTALKRTVAVKRPRRQDGDRRKLLMDEPAFSREGLVTALLDHPNIVPVYDLAFDALGVPMLAMKLVEGTPWNRLVDSDAELPVTEKLARHLPVLLLAARAVEFAHSRGILHRDLKPSQVVVGDYGETYLMDWGLAAGLPGFRTGTGIAVDEVATPLARAPNPAGTAAYMAPEQTINSPAHLGTWTDVYLLGGMLYYILTGRAPHQQDGAFSAFQHAAAGIVDPPEQHARGAAIPPELSRLCMAALTREPESRIQRASEFVGGIESFLSGRERIARSGALATEAAATLESADGRYDRFALAERLAEEAVLLQPDNVRALELRERVYAGFAGAALARDDLRLAAAQADRLPDSPRAETIRRQVATAAARVKRRKLHRRIAISAAFWAALLASVIVLLIVHQAADTHAFEQGVDSREKIRKVRIEAAHDREKREQARRDLQAGVGANRADIASLLRPFFVSQLVATDLETTNSWGETWLRAHPQEAAAMRIEIDRIRTQRADLATRGASLEPEPVQLLLLNGILRLAEDTTASRRIAYGAFTGASVTSPENVDAWTGRAIAAGRNDELTTAIMDARQAIKAAVIRGGQNVAPRGIARQVYQQFGESHPLPRGAIVIGSWANDEPARSRYGEISGSWADSLSTGRYKSAVPGAAAPPRAITRTFEFYQPYVSVPTTSPAVARFHPRLAAPEKRHVYITWPPQANADPVYLTVRHAHGETTVPLMMDGFGYAGAANSDRWISLGEYEFAAGGDQFVQIAAGEDVRPVGLNQFGAVCADAVCFSPTPLDTPFFMLDISDVRTTGIAGPAPGGFVRADPPLPWEPTPYAAIDRAQRENRPLCMLFWYPTPAGIVHPLSQSREYCLRRLLSHPAIAEILRTQFVLASVDMSHFPDIANRFKDGTGGTCILLCAPDATVRDRMAIGILPPSPVEFASRLAAVSAGAPHPPSHPE